MNFKRQILGYGILIFAFMSWGMTFPFQGTEQWSVKEARKWTINKKSEGKKIVPVDAEPCSVAFMFHHIFPDDPKTPIILSGGVRIFYNSNNHLDITQQNFLTLVKTLIRQGYWFPSPQQFVNHLINPKYHECSNPYAILIVDDPWNLPLIPVDRLREIEEKEQVEINIWSAVATGRITSSEVTFLLQNKDIIHPVSHSVTHNMHLSTWLEQHRIKEVEEELRTSQEYIAQIDPYGAKIFVYPGGAQNRDLIHLVSNYYEAAFLASPLHKGGNKISCVNQVLPQFRYLLPRINGADWQSAKSFLNFELEDIRYQFQDRGNFNKHQTNWYPTFRDLIPK